MIEGDIIHGPIARSHESDKNTIANPEVSSRRSKVELAQLVVTTLNPVVVKVDIGLGGIAARDKVALPIVVFSTGWVKGWVDEFVACKPFNVRAVDDHVVTDISVRAVNAHAIAAVQARKPVMRNDIGSSALGQIQPHSDEIGERVARHDNI